MNKGVPQVVLIGRDDTNKKKMYKQTYYPYFYMNENEYVRYKGEFGNLGKFVMDTEGTDARSLDKQVLTKVLVTDPKYITILMKQISKTNKVVLDNSLFTYEGDLSVGNLLPLRMLIDLGIKCGVNIEGETLTPIDFYPRLRIWYIDFEALSDKQGGYTPRNNDPIPIVTVYDSYENKLYTLFVVNSKWFGKGPKFTPDGIVESIVPEEVKYQQELIHFNNEGELLEHLANLIKEKDPDLITAWNLDRYDIYKWIDRMKANHLDPAILSPFNTFNAHSHPYKIKGRVSFDLMKAYKRFTDSELRSYSLGAVSEEEKLGVEKIPFKRSTQWLWDNEPWVLFNRNINDVLIIKALDDKYDLISMFDDLRQEFGTLFSEVLMNYRVIDTALMRMVNRQIALKTVTGEEKQTEDRYLGAVVVEPQTGLHEYIAQFDFSREYPSLIKAFNISPETYRNSEYKGDCYTITYLPKNCTVPKVFKFAKSPKGLIPKLIEYFFNKRTEYEKEMSKAIAEGQSESKIKMWSRRVYNMKKTSNAIYGVMDFGKFRLYNQNCSAATAILGRISVEEIAKYLESIGYNMIYGDTDSVFVELVTDSNEKAVHEGKQLQDKINLHLLTFFTNTYGLKKAPTDMGLKKIYNSFLLIAKKNYAGHSYWDEKKGYKEEYDFKGLEMIRSDSSDLEKIVMEDIVKDVLNGTSSGKINIVKSEVVAKLNRREFAPLQVAYPQQIKEPLKKYPKTDKNGKFTIPCHVRAAIYTNMYLNTNFDQGDKPRRLPIKESELKVGKGQKTLFSKDDPHQTECTWNKFTYPMKDISITEDTDVPSWLLNRIDWDRITERLTAKIDRVVELITK
jgi:DNA polymerase elongation subunit (family B)